jgi:hypothetical protein
MAAIADFPLPIAARRLLIDIGRSWHTTFPIVKRQSARRGWPMKTWSFRCGYAPLYSIPLNSH